MLASAPRTTIHLLLSGLLLLSASCDKKAASNESKGAATQSEAVAAPPLKGLPASGQGSTAPAAPGADKSPPQGSNAEPIETPSAEKLELLSAGAKPHAALRYQFTKGRTKKFVMQMQLEMSALANGAPAQSMPPTSFEFSGTTTTRDFDDKQRALRDMVFTSFRPTSAQVPPQMAQQMKEQMKSFEGMRLTETITNRGRVEAVDIDETSVKSPQAQMFLQNIMEGMSNAFLPLPEEPVGVGAKWQSKAVIDTSGVRVTQTGTFELAALDGTKATIKMTFEQSASPQAVHDPSMNPALKTELLSMQGTGSGTTEVDLKTLRTRGNVSIGTLTKTRVSSREQASADPNLPIAPAGIGQARSVDSTLTTKVSVTTQID